MAPRHTLTNLAQKERQLKVIQKGLETSAVRSDPPKRGLYTEAARDVYWSMIYISRAILSLKKLR